MINGLLEKTYANKHSCCHEAALTKGTLWGKPGPFRFLLLSGLLLRQVFLWRGWVYHGLPKWARRLGIRTSPPVALEVPLLISLRYASVWWRRGRNSSCSSETLYLKRCAVWKVPLQGKEHRVRKSASRALPSSFCMLHSCPCASWKYDRRARVGQRTLHRSAYIWSLYCSQQPLTLCVSWWRRRSKAWRCPDSQSIL